MPSFRLLCIFCELILGIYASTHWVVTENGLIQPRLLSPFNLARPYDLLAFLEQENRKNEISDIFQELNEKTASVDKHWSELNVATDIEGNLEVDGNCMKSGPLNVKDWYLVLAQDGLNREGLYLSDYRIDPKQKLDISKCTDEPKCREIIPLPFSMFVFEHLNAMLIRENVTMESETPLHHLLFPGMSVEQFGHEVARNLKANNTSWLHFNLASMYWRMKGNAYEAIECSRRAIRFSPRQFRDMALFNLAMVFHQARYPAEAANLLHAAVDHGPKQAVNHFALGNAYAVLADYNRSVVCYDNSLKLDPTYQQAITNKYAVLCHKMFMIKVYALQESLQNIDEDLTVYRERQERWLQLNEKMKQQLADTSTARETLFIEHHNIVSPRMQKLVKHIETQARLLNDKMVKTEELRARYTRLKANKEHLLDLSSLSMFGEQSEKPKEPYRAKKATTELNNVNIAEPDKEEVLDEYDDDDDTMEVLEIEPKYPDNYKVSRITEDFDKTSDWPTLDDCEKWMPTFPVNTRPIQPVYLPIENKGIILTSLLSHKINVPSSLDHPLPWYPPLCPAIRDKGKMAPYLPSHLNSKLSLASGDPLAHDYMKNMLVGYVTTEITGRSKSIQEAEIGQRILSAFNKKVAPKWILYTLASLYWRIRDNALNALTCLGNAALLVPPHHRDTVLVSLSSVLLQLGFKDEAFKLAAEAFAINKFEPATNLLLSMLHFAQRNTMGQLFHMKQVVRIEPDFMGGLARNLLRSWSCKIKAVALNKEIQKELADSEVCSDGNTEVRSNMMGSGMVCTAGGESCQPAHIHCYKADQMSDKGNANSDDSNHKVSSCSDCNTSPSDEYDQGTLETLLNEELRQSFHIHISLSEKHATDNKVFVSLVPSEQDLTEAANLLQRSGYQLTANACAKVTIVDWLSSIDVASALKKRGVDLTAELRNIQNHEAGRVPRCALSAAGRAGAGYVPAVALEPLPRLGAALAVLLGERGASISVLGGKIAAAIEQYPRTWTVYALAALYWRVLGDSKALVECVQTALLHAPAHQKDVLLLGLTALLQRQGHLQNAKEFAYYAYNMHPASALNAFVVAITHTELEEYDEAIPMYRVALALDSSFVAAKEWLQATMCILIFGDKGFNKVRMQAANG